VSRASELYAAYCVARLRRGGKQMEVMLKDEIDEHRAKSRAKDSGPWVNEYVPMALKTTVRKISKYLPKSNELLARALDLDDKADRGVNQDFDLPPEVTLIDEQPTGQAKGPSSPMDRLKATMGLKPDITVEAVDADAERLRQENEELDRQIAEREGQ
jgi:recombinational DNA repair protein RecT